MNRIFLLVLRAILFLLITFNVYVETGLFTTVVLALLYVASEFDHYRNQRTIRHLTSLQNHITTMRETHQKTCAELTSDFNSLARMIREKIKP